MPRIKGIDVEGRVQGAMDFRRASGEDFGTATGRAMQRLGGAVVSVGEVLHKRAEEDEVSSIAAEMSQLHADYAQKYREDFNKADPNDKEFAERFLDDFQQKAQEVGSKASTRRGQQHFQSLFSQMGSHFQTTAYAGQAELAGTKAKMDFVNTLDASSAALLNDPSSFDVALFNVESTLAEKVASGAIPAVKAEEFRLQSRRELAKSMIMGWAKADPEKARSDLENGKWDGLLDVDLKAQLIGNAKQELNARRADEAFIRESERRALEEAQKATGNKLLAKLELQGLLDPKEVINSNLDFHQKEWFIRLAEQKANREAKELEEVNPYLVRSLWEKIHLPDGHPDKIIDENDLNQYALNGLDMRYFNILRTEIQGTKTAEGKMILEQRKRLMETAKKAFTKSVYGIPDPDGDLRFAKFMSRITEESRELRKQGVTALELYDANHPKSLYKFIDQYRPTAQEVFSSTARHTGTGNDLLKFRAQEAQKTTPVPPPATPKEEVPKDWFGAPRTKAPPAPQEQNDWFGGPKKVRKKGESIQDFLKRKE